MLSCSEEVSNLQPPPCRGGALPLSYRSLSTQRITSADPLGGCRPSPKPTWTVGATHVQACVPITSSPAWGTLSVAEVGFEPTLFDL